MTYHILENGFIEVDITEDLFEASVINCDRTLFKNKSTIYNSLDKIKLHNLIGNIGEVCFEHVFKDAIRDNNYDYDFIFKGKKVDVKSKICKSMPKEEYVASVTKMSYLRQSNDCYVFVRVRDDYKKCWIVGIIGKKNLVKFATLREVGYINPTNSHKTDSASYDIVISKLIKMNNYLKGDLNNGYK